MGRFDLAVDTVRVSVDPESGGRIAQVAIDGHQIIHDRVGNNGDQTPTEWGAFPMAPYAGRIRRGRFLVDGVEHVLPLRNGRHAMHGTVLDRPWTVTSRTATSCAMRIEIGPDWPWSGWCVQHLELSQTGLSLSLEVHTAGEPFPATAGWHPWFRTRLASGATLRLDIDAGQMARRDDEGIPTGEWQPPTPRPWDDCLRQITWPVRLRWERDDHIDVGIDVWADTDHLVVYDQLDHAWCVEPQTAPPDALGTTANIVTPDDPLVVTGEWRWIRRETPYLSGE